MPAPTRIAAVVFRLALRQSAYGDRRDVRGGARRLVLVAHFPSSGFFSWSNRSANLRATSTPAIHDAFRSTFAASFVEPIRAVTRPSAAMIARVVSAPFDHRGTRPR